MTEQEKKELSKAVADKYGIDFLKDINHPLIQGVWLHDDSARVFDLMVEHDLLPQVYGGGAFDEYFYSVAGYPVVQSKYHPTKQEATRIAILKALLAKD